MQPQFFLPWPKHGVEDALRLDVMAGEPGVHHRRVGLPPAGVVRPAMHEHQAVVVFAEVVVPVLAGDQLAAVAVQDVHHQGVAQIDFAGRRHDPPVVRPWFRWLSVAQTEMCMISCHSVQQRMATAAGSYSSMYRSMTTANRACFSKDADRRSNTQRSSGDT